MGHRAAAEAESSQIFVNTPYFPDLNAPPTLRGFISPSRHSNINTNSSSTSFEAAPPPPSVYFKHLHDQHQELFDSAQEYVPPSRPNSPASVARRDALRECAVEKWHAAGGDTTAGKWGHLVLVLKLGCTRGRFLVRRLDERKEEKEVGKEGRKWVLPGTEEEWFELEKNWEREDEENAKKERSRVSGKAKARAKAKVRDGDTTTNLHEKVRGWQATVDVDLESPSAPKLLEEDLPGGKVATKAASVKTKARSSKEKEKDPCPLGFPVVKRSSATATATKEKGPAVVHFESVTKEVECAPSDKDPVPVREPTPPPTPVQDTAKHADMASPQSVPGIAELSEMSFLPPSFPSQLQTSTPQVAVREKPPPIAPRHFPSSPSSSPQMSNVVPEQSNPTIGVGKPLSYSSSQPLVSKRARPLTPPSDDVQEQTSPRAVKKARTMPVLMSSGPPVTTPPRSTTPTSPPAVLGNAKGLPVSSTPDRRPLPTLTELLASSRRSRPRPRPPSRKTKSTTVSPVKEKAEEGPSREHTPVRQDPSPAKSYFSSPASGSTQGSTMHQPLRSPVSPIFTQNPSAFLPDFMSTQAQFGHAVSADVVSSLGTDAGGGLVRGSSGVFGMGYNSQFDVEGRVDRVSELLERDVDFDGWLRDVPSEASQPLPELSQDGL